jgi:hypothetical protein
VGYPEVDRWRSLFQVDSQFGEDLVGQVNPGAGENESGVTWRFAGRWLFRERTELAGILWRQVWPQADEVSTLWNSHFALYTLAPRGPPLLVPSTTYSYDLESLQ